MYAHPIYGADGRAWFWRAWPENHVDSRDFRLKTEARTFLERNGGGGMRKMRYRTENCSETRMDTIHVPAQLTL